MAGNPRIDDLRRRLEKDPGSRLFAQLAEELRKDGDLEEAINVCREGLKRQPAYPSARMTLGRALFDTGDLAAARVEFETVIKGAPDNILASRLLAESLEGLGDLQAAAKQYRTTLALAPGDKQVQGHLDAVEKRLKAGPAAAPATAAPPAASVTPPTIMTSVTPPTIIMAPPSPPPASAATVRAPRPPDLATDTSPDKYPMPEEPEPPPAPPAPIQRDYAPIPLAAADETFELEAMHESPPTKVGGGAGAAGADWVVGVAMPSPPPPAGAPEPFPMPEEPPAEAPLPKEETAFELEEPYESPVTQWAMPSPAPEAPAPIVEEPAVAAEPATDFAEEFAPPEPRPRPVGMPMELPPLSPEPKPSPAPEPVTAAPVPAPAALEPPPPPVAATPEPMEPAPPPAEPVGAPPAADLSSSTLAELYFNQGHTDRALDVYRQLLQREPGNDRARARITELEALDRHLRAEETRGPQPERGAPVDPAAARRQAIERTIARLEAMLAAIKKEQP